MPELPEVETIKNGLCNLVLGKKITEVFRSPYKLRLQSSCQLEEIIGKKIVKINRKARYLIFEFDVKYALIVHLGMSGRIIYHENLVAKKKHDHFIGKFDDGSCLVFNDPRRFGFVDLILKKDLASHKMLINLGCEPLSDEFNAKYLASKIANKKMNIKTAMMDNRIVVGVGNIYINESLFLAKISPLKSAHLLTKKEIEKLVSVIKIILKKAISSGGSSINDYVDSKGVVGNFQHNFKVYSREKKECLDCGAVIFRIMQNGRSTFYCKSCQKE